MLNKKMNDWVKCCITWEVEGIRQTGRPKKTQWDCVKNDMGKFRPAQFRMFRMHSSAINGGELRGNQLTQVHLENGC